MFKLPIYCVLVLLIVSGCSVKKYLPKGERLYHSATIKIIKEGSVKTSTSALINQVKLADRLKTNKVLFGKAYKVWWWYAIGEPKRPKGIRAFFRRKLGERPILSSAINASVTAANMQTFLENRGYFHSTATGDTVNTGYYAKAIYTAHVRPQYTIKNINWISDSSDLMKLLIEEQQKGILKIGNSYRLSDLQAERDRLDGIVKTKGFFYFNPEYLMAYVDSTVGSNQVDIFLSLKSTTPENAKHAFTINQVTVFPNYTLLLPPPDTSKAGTFDLDGLTIRDTILKFKPRLFSHIITYRPGDLYSSKDQNTTQNRLINLGSLKFVKNRYEQVADEKDPYKLNVFYYLTPAKKKSFQLELDGFSKENKYFGTQLSLNWRNRNAFRGSELLTARVYGGYEFSFSDSIETLNNFRLGTEIAINFPHYVLPFFKIKENNLYAPRTRILLGYELFRKNLFYTKNIYRLQYEYHWKVTSNKEHNFAPLAFAYINGGNLSDRFNQKLATRPSLVTNVYSEMIVGSFYSYTFNTANPFAKNQWYFMTSVDLSGNIAGLISGAKDTRSKTVFGTPFAQYVKFDIDSRYQLKLPNNFDWVSKIQIGIGVPYNNSNLLPFSKQYVIGGGGSMRGFTMRKLGPGSHRPTLEEQQYFQLIGGDYKLQINSELRMPIYRRIFSAVFVDIGNIWSRDTLLYGRAGKLKKDFIKELAVSAGAGLRFDLGLILFRFDIGMPLRIPYLPEKQRWVFDKLQLQNGEWRRNNLVFNIALGYPF